METKGSLSHYNCPTPFPILNEYNSVHTPTIHVLKIILLLSSYVRLGIPSGSFPSGFPTETPYTPLFSLIRAIWLTHLIFLDFITRALLGVEYRSLSSSLCSFLQFLVILNHWRKTIKSFNNSDLLENSGISVQPTGNRGKNSRIGKELGRVASYRVLTSETISHLDWVK
jgi:hypothetical protein